eukprot:jgi/Botrbrau1/736/Bobra.160_2s0059.1
MKTLSSVTMISTYKGSLRQNTAAHYHNFRKVTENVKVWRVAAFQQQNGFILQRRSSVGGSQRNISCDAKRKPRKGQKLPAVVGELDSKPSKPLFPLACPMTIG